MELLRQIQKIEILLEENEKVKKNKKVKIKDKKIQDSLSNHYGESFNVDEVIKNSIEQHLAKLRVELKDFGLDDFLKSRLVALLRKAGLPGENDDEMIEHYEKSLAVSEGGYRVIHKRDVDEIYVNNYNPAFLLASARHGRK